MPYAVAQKMLFSAQRKAPLLFLRENCQTGEIPTPLNDCLGMTVLFGVHAVKFPFIFFSTCASRS